MEDVVHWKGMGGQNWFTWLLNAPLLVVVYYMRLWFRLLQSSHPLIYLRTFVIAGDFFQLRIMYLVLSGLFFIF